MTPEFEDVSYGFIKIILIQNLQQNKSNLGVTYHHDIILQENFIEMVTLGDKIKLTGIEVIFNFKNDQSFSKAILAKKIESINDKIDAFFNEQDIKDFKGISTTISLPTKLANWIFEDHYINPDIKLIGILIIFISNSPNLVRVGIHNHIRLLIAESSGTFKTSNSSAIQETREDYICQDCGCALGIQKFVYNRPYEIERHQYAVLNKTCIGARNKRLRNPHSKRLEKLNSYQTRNTNDENLKIKAKAEIHRILAALQCPHSLGDTIFRKYQEIREKISPCTKYRNPEKLVPIVIYYYHKLNNCPISQAKLLEIARISKKDFNDFTLQINEFLPHYQERNRQDYILGLLSKLSEHYGWGVEFYYHTKYLLYKLWDIIKNTTGGIDFFIMNFFLFIIFNFCTCLCIFYPFLLFFPP